MTKGTLGLKKGSVPFKKGPRDHIASINTMYNIYILVQYNVGY